MSLVLCLSTFLYAEDAPVTLEYRFTPGQTLQYQHEASMKGSQEVLEGAPEVVPQATSQTFSAKIVTRATLKTKSVESDGSAWVDVSYETFGFSQTLNGMEVSGGGEGTGLNALFQDLTGKTIILRLHKNGKLLDVADTPDETLNAQMVNQFQQMYGQTEGVFPDRPVRIGESWIKELQLPIAGLAQNIVVNFQNTLESFERVGDRDCAKIGSSLTFSLSEEKLTPKEGEGDSLDISVKMDGHGRMEQYFDLSEGVMVKGEGTTTTTSIQSVSVPMMDTADAQTIESRSTIELTFKTELE